MQVYNMTQKKFSTFEPLNVGNDIFHTEGQLFVGYDKNKWNKRKILLKKLYHNNGEVFSNKLYTVNELIDNRDQIGMEELILPESLFAVRDEIQGFILPFIPNVNLQTVLNSQEFTVSQKLSYLKEVGHILEKMRNLRKYSKVNDLYLNDVHENNFILNTDTGKINVVDLDSAKIGNNLVMGSRYLSPMSQLSSVPKYVPLNYSVGGFYEVNEDTEIYCYIIMIFKYLFKENIARLKIDEFYSYLEYLSSIGVPKDFLDKVACIYLSKDNENPYEYLEELEEFYPNMTRDAFVRSRVK